MPKKKWTPQQRKRFARAIAARKRNGVKRSAPQVTGSFAEHINILTAQGELQGYRHAGSIDDIPVYVHVNS